MKFRKLDTDDFLLLALLGDGLSTTQVAAAMNIAQPAVSARLRRLREITGDDLLKRKGRGLEPTAKGIDLIAKATHIVSLLMGAFPDTSSDGRRNTLVHDVFGEAGDRTTGERDHSKP